MVPFLISLCSQGVAISIGVFLIYHLGLKLPVWMILLIFPIAFWATILPIAPAGIGIGQAAFFFLFDKVAAQGEFGVLAITFYQAIQFIVGLFGGVVFVLYKKPQGIIDNQMSS